MFIENGPEIKFKKLHSDAKIPFYAHEDDAGFDLFTVEDGQILVGERKKIPLGLAAEISKGWCVLFIGKSGLADRSGVAILGGLIDSGYRGEWQAILLNTGDEVIRYGKGDKVTQGVVLYNPQAKIIEVHDLSETDRGQGGFGSTGK